ncbi:hypothetical protein TGP89_419750 [Toxoplasma gondii p89]|uniref:Uncharacterized protein n=1 Tax=Toxoplasma gondii p89 TaxID=943119 RepID=A0A086K539_TOXGO|nr:hypothetical protein TGP89_419750 [Toxoplasma gondii p89]
MCSYLSACFFFFRFPFLSFGQITPHPSLSAGHVPLHKRIEEEVTKKQVSLERMEEKQRRAELSSCTFAPRILSRSRLLASREKNAHTSSSSSSSSSSCSSSAHNGASPLERGKRKDRRAANGMPLSLLDFAGEGVSSGDRSPVFLSSFARKSQKSLAETHSASAQLDRKAEEEAKKENKENTEEAGEDREEEKERKRFEECLRDMILDRKREKNARGELRATGRSRKESTSVHLLMNFLDVKEQRNRREKLSVRASLPFSLRQRNLSLAGNRAEGNVQREKEKRATKNGQGETRKEGSVLSALSDGAGKKSFSSLPLPPFEERLAVYSFVKNKRRELLRRKLKNCFLSILMYETIVFSSSLPSS